MICSMIINLLAELGREKSLHRRLIFTCLEALNRKAPAGDETTENGRRAKMFWKDDERSIPKGGFAGKPRQRPGVRKRAYDRNNVSYILYRSEAENATD